ncbi:MAG: 23S rRNA (adenine(2030)-N(6))-methyltransferase RlmJ [Pseudomonadales bacterium]
MLSYRHGFHAGNHADVLKHVVLVTVLSYLTAKPKALWYVDTHAGAGVYSLKTGFADRNREHESGIGRLWPVAMAPAAVTRYLDLIRALNPAGELDLYPGSPWLAAHVLRPQDRLWLHELHPAEQEALAGTLTDRRISIRATDGFDGLRALLPPATRRSLVLIDPPYEVKTDYDRVAITLADALERFRTGTYAIWYPLLAGGRSERLVEKLTKLNAPGWLDASLTVRTPTPTGMHGSGIFVINPPYTLSETLSDVLPFLADTLAQDPAATFTLRSESR